MGKRPKRLVGFYVGAVILVLLMAGAALARPRIELEYHRYRFRNGTTEERVEALRWICEHRLARGMSKEEVEQVIGAPLGELAGAYREDTPPKPREEKDMSLDEWLHAERRRRRPRSRRSDPLANISRGGRRRARPYYTLEIEEWRGVVCQLYFDGGSYQRYEISWRVQEE